MTDKQKLFKLLKTCNRTGRLLNTGLCSTLTILGISKSNLDLFEPNDENRSELLLNNKPCFYWGAEEFDDDFLKKFTPLRELILCFLIAMEE